MKNRIQFFTVLLSVLCMLSACGSTNIADFTSNAEVIPPSDTPVPTAIATPTPTPVVLPSPPVTAPPVHAEPTPVPPPETKTVTLPLRLMWRLIHSQTECDAMVSSGECCSAKLNDDRTVTMEMTDVQIQAVLDNTKTELNELLGNLCRDPYCPGFQSYEVDEELTLVTIYSIVLQRSVKEILCPEDIFPLAERYHAVNGEAQIIRLEIKNLEGMLLWAKDSEGPSQFW